LNTRDLKDTVDKLHSTNKARHEAEQQLGEAMEREKEMKELLRMKDSMIQGKINDIEDMDKSISEKDQ